MDRYRIKPKQKVSLKEWDPDDTSAFKGNKKDGEAHLLKLNEELEPLQELLYAEGKRRLLVVLQGMDASGKDGVIRHVFEGVNPQGVSVVGFKAPTPEELAHDYLWRIHRHVPGKGQVVIFNRSHYEDVLVVRVKNLAPPRVWRKRYDQINAFEKMLTDEGVTILKFFLYIDKDEQKKRLEERLHEPGKQWKFNPGDLDDRKLWGDFMNAYETVLEKTSTSWAPWYLVPANKKWYRNLVIGSVMVETLKEFKMSYPPLTVDPDTVVIE